MILIILTLILVSYLRYKQEVFIERRIGLNFFNFLKINYNFKTIILSILTLSLSLIPYHFILLFFIPIIILLDKKTHIFIVCFSSFIISLISIFINLNVNILSIASLSLAIISAIIIIEKRNENIFLNNARKIAIILILLNTPIIELNIYIKLAIATFIILASGLFKELTPKFNNKIIFKNLIFLLLNISIITLFINIIWLKL